MAVAETTEGESTLKTLVLIGRGQKPDQCHRAIAPRHVQSFSRAAQKGTAGHGKIFTLDQCVG